MKKSTISFGQILDNQIRLAHSWFLILILLAWALAVVYLPPEIALPVAAYWLLGAITALLVLASVMLHEMSHALVALWLRSRAGLVTLFVFGGVPELSTEPSTALAESLIAFAGPVTSLVLAGAFGILAAASGKFMPLSVVAEYTALFNGLLALFNLIPAYPLDGGRVLRAMIWRSTDSISRATKSATVFGRVIAFLLMAIGLWQAAIGNLNSLWLVLVAWLLQRAAAHAWEQQDLADLLIALPATHAAGLGYIRVPDDWTLDRLVDQYLTNPGARAFVVQRSGIAVGVLTWYQINAVSRSSWRTTSATQVMSPIAADQWASWEEHLRAASARVQSMASGEHPA